MSINNPTCAEKALVLLQKELETSRIEAELEVLRAKNKLLEREIALKDVSSSLELLYQREYPHKRPF